MKMIFAFTALLLTQSVFAGVSAYSGKSGQKLFIEEGDKGAFFVKFTGVKTPWENKVIKTERTGKEEKYRYSFGYKLELSNGVHDRTYTMITEARSTLVAGSIVEQISLYTPENSRDGVTLTWDKDLTEKSQDLKLSDEHKKKPFTPEVP